MYLKKPTKNKLNKKKIKSMLQPKVKENHFPRWLPNGTRSISYVLFSTKLIYAQILEFSNLLCEHHL